MPILTDIEAKMYTLISGMLTADGYNFNWGNVNQPDMALQEQDKPAALIYVIDEDNQDQTNGTWSSAYNNSVNFRIRTHSALAEVADVPLFEINAELNKQLDDLKKLFGTYYNLDGLCMSIMYRKMKRIIHENNDVHIPKSMDTFWLVRYSQDRTDPESVVA